MENPFAPPVTDTAPAAPADASASPFAPAPPAAAPAAPAPGQTAEAPPVGPALSKGQLVAQVVDDPWKGKVSKAGIVLHAYTDEHGRNQAVIGWLDVSGESLDTAELSAV